VDRTAGGHPYSAGEGAESHIDDGNDDMIALMRQLAKRGLVKIVEDVKKATLDSGTGEVKKAVAKRTAKPVGS
jgi:hypothetical protein